MPVRDPTTASELASVTIIVPTVSSRTASHLLEATSK